MSDGDELKAEKRFTSVRISSSNIVMYLSALPVLCDEESERGEGTVMFGFESLRGFSANAALRGEVNGIDCESASDHRKTESEEQEKE